MCLNNVNAVIGLLAQTGFEFRIHGRRLSANNLRVYFVEQKADAVRVDVLLVKDVVGYLERVNGKYYYSGQLSK